jgi:hypothetical protein
MRRIRQSSNFKIRARSQLRNAHVTEMERVETPRLRKIQFELDRKRRANNINVSQTTINGGGAAANNNNKPSSSLSGFAKPDSNSLAE